MAAPGSRDVVSKITPAQEAVGQSYDITGHGPIEGKYTHGGRERLRERVNEYALRATSELRDEKQAHTGKGVYAYSP